MNFQKMVIYIAMFIMFLCLIGVFVMLYNSSGNRSFPPTIGKCPDFFYISQNRCVNYAGVGDPTYGQAPNGITPSASLTPAQACELKNTLREKRQTWDGITNNPNICSI